ncbi:DUF3667 domain-containing protein [Undibacterium sp. CY18W]|uniref:DUF3667 domain-containing protein n=1 Tax=Undibacterium hunanense TaxID=2762292 RepID=A0ABR6ZSN7_9BURK|nr:DUF3667 domain-containing protein [Undibacterium hunanense]MBC3918834.1 DUF3667 domain-containing protein [Undibacterium hunanense]
MNVDVEIATDVATAAVLVNEAQKGGAHASSADEHHHACANCNTSLQGAFCHACGQAAHIHRSLLHLVEELLHGLLHFETKAWRTIPKLIWSPGKLTRDYIEGQRTRHVSPLALFLFLIFLMFFVFSFTTSNPLESISDKPQTKVGISKALQDNQAKLTTLQSERAQLPAGDPKLEELDQNISNLQSAITALESSLNLLGMNNGETSQKKADGTYDAMGKIAQKLDEKLLKKIEEKQTKEAETKQKITVTSSLPGIQEKIRHAVNTPELTLYKMKSNASKLAFMLMPISLPFLWLLFIFKRRFSMFDHAVFSLYSLSFMALLLMTTAILNTLSFSTAAILLFVFVPPVHMFRQLRQAYQLGIAASLWRTIALLFVAGCSLLIYLLLILSLSA